MVNPLKVAEVAADVAKPVVSGLVDEAAALLSSSGAKGGRALIGHGPIDWLERAKAVVNPYLRDFEATQVNPTYKRAIDITRGRIGSTHEEYRWAFKEQMTTRYGLTHKYAWAVPNSEALAAVGEQGKIVEAGAGSGYWAHLLRSMKADVVAFDEHGSNLAANRFHSSGHAWTDIIQGDASTVKQYPDRSLFMSFPPADDPFAHNVLKNFKGDRFVYVGEPAGGITGDSHFHDLLARRWRETKTVEIPRWEASDGFLQDSLTVFERR